MNSTTDTLYEDAGPRGRRRHRLLAAAFGLGVAALVWWVVTVLAAHGQFAVEKWSPFLRAEVWLNLLLPGLWGTVRIAAVAGTLALVVGVVLGIGRLARMPLVRGACAAVVEFGRSVPLLLLIIFAQVGSFYLIGHAVVPFTAVVFGLVVYNGAVLAEVVRAGVRALPRGQEEAALALGLPRVRVMQKVLLPQALRAMLPAVIMQLVTLLKDTALAFVVSYPELLRAGQLVGNQFGNIVPTAVVIAVMYIALNVGLSSLATRVEGTKRSSRVARRLLS